MSRHFSHLHNHTEYSLLDGAISLDKLIGFGKEHDFRALAITDHGNVFGAVKFFQKAKAAGIKPILGIEAYITEDIAIKKVNKKYYHLILLVENEIGYRNLCKLIAISYRDGFYFKPRIDYAALEKHHEGLIATSACLGGHISQDLMNGNDAGVIERVDWFKSVFGPERFYLEIQPEDQMVQKEVNEKLVTLAQAHNLKMIATADCHYTNAEDREAHEIMLSIQTHDKIDNPKRYTFGDCRVYLRTAQQMCDALPAYHDAIWNTGDIADRCNFDFETGKLFFPQFPIPDNLTREDYFKKLCAEGLERRRPLIPEDQWDSYVQRLETEMNLISSMGFIEYFLVVSDFIQWAYRTGIPVGPGRGSAAGSVVSWSLQITNIDPMKYNLLFERFLNPERVTMPDIDIDFCIEGRDRVINYVRDTYGHDKTCHIITFGTMLAKGVIKDVARVLGFPFEDSNAITSLIPDQLKITLNEAIEQEPRLKELIDTNQKVKHLFEVAFKLEGLTRHASKHAAGIVISPEPIDEVLPVYVPPKSDELVAQYAMTELESLGFLKIDFLGLKNLTLIDRAVTLIKKTRTLSININTLPLDDPAAFKLICEGKTSGVFQLESSGLKEVLRKLQPDKFEDIIAVNALYRPGPLGSGMVDDYVERRHGRQKITYIFPELEPILAETYGVIVYQEQVMKIASTIAGYSLGESDILRRAMGKKKVDVMAEQRKLFLSRAVERSFDERKAGELFDLMAYFAGYGFNKSHSAAYALIAYQTAYLKANFLPEFMACLISLEAGNAEKMAFYLQEAKDLGLELQPPNINRSQVNFDVIDGSILFGLQGIKNVGSTALDSLLNAREKDGTFDDILELCMRADLRTVNKRVMEQLICSGALDTLPGTRAQKHQEIGTILEQAAVLKRDAATGQMGLFASSAQKNSKKPIYVFSSQATWTPHETLEKEKEAVGFYLSAHPLETHQTELNRLDLTSFSKALSRALAQKGDQEPTVICCGLLKSKREILTKKGDRMAFVQLEGKDANAEIILFPRVFTACQQWLDDHQVFVVKGNVDLASVDRCKIKANVFMPIERVLDEWPRAKRIQLNLPQEPSDEVLQAVRDALIRGSVPLELLFEEQGKKLKLTTKKRIRLDQEALETVESLGAQVMINL